MARELGIRALYVKDESALLGLNSFKARGALWAAAMICARRFGLRENPPDMREINSHSQKEGCKLAFVTATDGNHGAAIAHAAAILGQRAIVFLPRDSSPGRFESIKALGAECLVSEVNYDETVTLAAAFAANRRHILIQDTAWPGYEGIPALIMAGYASMAREIASQLAGKLPTHVFLQVGVGSFAAAMISAFGEQAWVHGERPPIFICMEPENAAPLYMSIQAGGKAPHEVSGSLATNMDGLACGKLSSLAWPMLRDYVYATARCPDGIADLGMRLLANPVGADPVIASGPSGAIGAGLLWQLKRGKQSLWRNLQLDAGSTVLLVSTEGRLPNPATRASRGSE